MIEYLDEDIRPLVLIMPKMSDYVKTLMSFQIDDEKLLQKYKVIQITIEDLKVYDDRYIKTKLRTYNDKVYTNCGGLNLS